MSAITTIAGRELKSLFVSPIAYLVLFLFFIAMGTLFSLMAFRPNELAEIRPVTDFSRFALFFILPGLTMSIFSEEYKTGRIEMLRTSPITEAQLLLGKFFGAYAFYLVLLAATLVYVLLLTIYGRPDWGQTMAAYLGMLLMGGMFIAVGIFFSACTKDQIVAYLATLLVLGFLTFASGLSTLLPTNVSLFGLTIPAAATLNYLGVGSHIGDFSKGVVDTAHVSYFLLVTLFFLLMTYLLLESRKWR